MKTFGSKILKRVAKWPWKTIGLILLTVLFFSFTVVITYDGGHYLNYVAIFERELPASSWDIVRGPIMPIIIFLFDKLFGKTSTGILVGMFLFYLLFAALTYLIAKELTRGMKRQKLIQDLIVAILILNPLIFGYFHVLLTEFVAIPVMMANIYVGFRWIFSEKKKKAWFLFAAYWAVSIAFCYHLKQPYLTISFFPLLIATVLALIRNHSKRDWLKNVGIIATSMVFLVGTILVWNKIIDRIGADKNTGRDTSSMLGMQLLNTAQIPLDIDGDGEKDQLSGLDAAKIIFTKFTENPAHIIKIYAQNYCGLISMCKITTPNGVDFFSTGELTPLSLYENNFIAYQPYRESDGISSMPEGQYERALRYQSNIDRGSFATVMYLAEFPTTILFKISMIFYPLAFVFILIVRRKDKTRKHDRLFYSSLFLLCATGAHLIVSGVGLGLIIDRYAIEAFAPAVMGTFGASRYWYLVLASKKATKKIKTEK